MASITIRNLDDAIKARLRVRAAQHGHSMEEEARDLLRTGLATEPPPSGSLIDAVRRRFKAVGPVSLRIPVREPMRDPPELDE